MKLTGLSNTQLTQIIFSRRSRKKTLFHPKDPEITNYANPATEGKAQDCLLPHFNFWLIRSGWRLSQFKEAEEHTQRLIEEGQQGYILTASVNEELV